MSYIREKKLTVQDLGSLSASFGVSAAFTQKVFIVAVLSVFFFGAMLTMFFIRQGFGYLILAAAFLFLELLTLVSWAVNRKSFLMIYEKGLIYRRSIAAFADIRAVEAREKNKRAEYEIIKKDGGRILLTDAVNDVASAVQIIRQKIS